MIQRWNESVRPPRLQLELKLEICGQTVLLNHMPYASDAVIDGYDEKFQQYRPKNEGLWLLTVTFMKNGRPRGR